MLVGGTALAGYYAGHRRSDDLDLFVRDDGAFRAAVLAVKSLTELGAAVEERQGSTRFYSATCALDGHAFTVQVVLDANLFTVGACRVAADGAAVADLPTLLRMKAATLVSRCAEKDLYDLAWLFDREPGLTVERLLELGSSIDGGMTAEGVLTSMVGTTLTAAACGFSPAHAAGEVFRRVSRLKERLEHGFAQAAENKSPPPIGELIRKLRPT